MTEEKKKRQVKNRYIRQTKLVEFFNSGITEFDALISAIVEFEKTVPLRKGIKVERDHAFYKKTVQWCLTQAHREGTIVYLGATKKRAAKEKVVVDEAVVAPQVVSEDLTPTL